MQHSIRNGLKIAASLAVMTMMILAAAILFANPVHAYTGKIEYPEPGRIVLTDYKSYSQTGKRTHRALLPERREPVTEQSRIDCKNVVILVFYEIGNDQIELAVW